MTRPIAAAMPPSVIRLNVIPASRIATSVTRIVTGMTRIATRVTRQFFRNR
jgi:hypothetical protein